MFFWGHRPEITIIINYTDIVKTIENIKYFAEMRQRWEEIKKLQVAVPYYRL